MDPKARDHASGSGRQPRRLPLQRPGACVACGTVLAGGVVAVWDPVARTVQCVECPTEHRRAAPDAPIDHGVAGRSAQAEYERRAASREARFKDRFGQGLGRVALAVTAEPQTTRAWDQGARGEQALAKALAAVAGIIALHDRRVPGTKGNIDHLVAAPAGVFIVDAKRYEGHVEIRDLGGLFSTDKRLYVGGRDRSTLADHMGWQVEAVERSLESIPVEPAPPVIPVLCFIDADWPIFRPPDSFRDVRLASERTIGALVTKQRVVDPTQIEHLARLLATAFPPKA